MSSENEDKDRKRIENKRCKCITSLTFPHRYKNCLLRKVVGDSVHKKVFIPTKATNTSLNANDDSISNRLLDYTCPITRNDKSISQGYIYGFVEIRNVSHLIKEHLYNSNNNNININTNGNSKSTNTSDINGSNSRVCSNDKGITNSWKLYWAKMR